MSKAEGKAGGKSRSRQATKRETREALIRAGVALFLEDGADLPSLDAICARAGFTRGAFYVHFRDRDDFLAAVVDSVLMDFVNTMVVATGTGKDLGDTISRFLEGSPHGQIPLLGHHRLMLHLLTRGTERTQEMRARFKALLEHALSGLTDAAATGQRAGTVGSKVEAELIATWLLAAALGLHVLLDFGVSVDMSRIVKSADELLRLQPG